MKLFALTALVLLQGVACTQNPAVTRTIQLIQDLFNQVKRDGKAEQASFDEYACWCEKTMERKASDISRAKDVITETEILMKKLKGESASHSAEIEQLEKDIAQNEAAVKEAQELRNKEYKEYMEERTESEQCIGALEAAITVLTGAGTKSFLQGATGKIHEAQLLSVVAGVQKSLKNKAAESMSGEAIEIVKHFITKPDDFVGEKKSNGMSAAQVGHTNPNPFGDYAPQSTQIQGILKGMYDAFTSDLEKDNVNEANAEKSFQEIFGTKMQELETLKLTLQTQEGNRAAKKKRLAESEQLLADTEAALEADEAFFQDTKIACAAKASEWSVRSRLRTEEMNGMQQAINILSSPEAQKTFKDSAETFLQLKAVNTHQERSSDRLRAFNKLKNVAGLHTMHGRNVAQIALALKSGGHFDKVIEMIDAMIALIRKEEQDDIEHRDRCQNDENANGNELVDLKHEIDKTEASLKHMEMEKKETEENIQQLEQDMAETKKEQEALLKMRNEEVAEFRQAVKDDTDAISLLKQAMVAMEEFYKRNDQKVPRTFMQKSPEYSHDEDKAPETVWSGDDYKGRRSETGGIIAILEMLIEDVHKEIKEGKADDADAQAKYEKQNGALQDTYDSQEESKVHEEESLADLEKKMDMYDDYKNEKEADKKAEGETKKAIYTDCSWVASHFESRREKRKNEVAGLEDARAFLAGAAGDVAPEAVDAGLSDELLK
jgi:hypothetical protein